MEPFRLLSPKVVLGRGGLFMLKKIVSTNVASRVLLQLLWVEYWQQNDKKRSGFWDCLSTFATGHGVASALVWSNEARCSAPVY